MPKKNVTSGYGVVVVERSGLGPCASSPRGRGSFGDRSSRGWGGTVARSWGGECPWARGGGWVSPANGIDVMQMSCRSSSDQVRQNACGCCANAMCIHPPCPVPRPYSHFCTRICATSKVRRCTRVSPCPAFAWCGRRPVWALYTAIVTDCPSMRSEVDAHLHRNVEGSRSPFSPFSAVAH